VFSAGVAAVRCPTTKQTSQFGNGALCSSCMPLQMCRKLIWVQAYVANWHTTKLGKTYRAQSRESQFTVTSAQTMRIALMLDRDTGINALTSGPVTSPTHR